MSKELPESKPEPEKNCGNCGKHKCQIAYLDDGYPCWQPKAAEPQGWEQRFDAIINLPKDCKNCKWDRESDSGHCTAEPTCDFSPEIDLKKIKSFIRAEIERAREDARNLPPNERAKARSKTFPGIAKSNG